MSSVAANLPGWPTFRSGGTVPDWVPSPGGEIDRSILLDAFPEFRPVHAYFTQIAVPALSIDSGLSACYGLASIRIPENIGQEAALVYVHIDQLPCDVDGAEGSSPAAWGTIKGLGAAIAVMLDPPVEEGEWAAAPANIPGVETATTASRRRVLSGFDSYIVSRTFPSGKLTDATPTRQTTSQAFAPLAVRLTEGSRLGVCLFINRAKALAASGLNINGYASIQLGLGLARPRSEFQQ